MRRVVVTGIGIVSSIGNDKEEVRRALKEGRSGIVAAPEYKEMGFRSHVHGAIKLDPETAIDRRLRYYADGATAVVLRRPLGRGCGSGTMAT